MPYIHQDERIPISLNSTHKPISHGVIFNSLTINAGPFKCNRSPAIYYECLCKCGKLVTVRATSLLAGLDKANTHAVTSCGCRRTETIKQKIKTHACACGQRDPAKFAKHNKSVCAKCWYFKLYNGNSEIIHLRRLIAGIRSRSHRKLRRKLVCEIASKDLLELWATQHGLCAISGLPMVHNTKSLYSASIDRINSDIGYTKENVQLVCLAINLAKRAHTNEEITDFLKSYVRLQNLG